MSQTIYLLYDGWEGSAEMDAMNRGIKDAMVVGNYDGFVVMETTMFFYERIVRWWMEGTSLRRTIAANVKIKRRGNTVKKVAVE